jgi:hypothetical protein
VIRVVLAMVGIAALSGLAAFAVLQIAMFQGVAR